MSPLAWLAVVAVAAVGVDRAATWAESRGWLYWRRRKPSGASGGMVGELIAVFQPSREHVVAERDRTRLDIQRATDGAPDLRIDLDAGTVHLPAPPARRPAEDGD